MRCMRRMLPVVWLRVSSGNATLPESKSFYLILGCFHNLKTFLR